MKATQKDSKFDPEKVSIDYFLYSCFEHENSSRSWPIGGDTRWPVAIACSKQERPSELEQSDLEGLISQICLWYKEKSPQLCQPDALNLETLADIIPAFMMMTQDIDTVVKSKTGDYLPTYDSDLTDEVWVIVNKCIAEHFTSHGSMFLRYLHWSHASQPQEIEVEVGSRPPVGRFAPGFRKSSSPSGNERQRPRSDRNGNRAKDGRRNQGRDRQDRQNRQNNKTHGRRDNKKNAQLERDSLKAVLVAVQKLNEDKSLQEYQLPPTNSFYRRLQHKQIKAEGLFSRSDGAGNDRRVVILRTRPDGATEHSDE